MKSLSKAVSSLLLVVLVVGAGQVLAAGPKPDVANNILDRLKEARADLEYAEVTLTPIPGLYAVQVIGGPVLYVTEEANYFVAGELFSIEPGQFVSIQEQARAKERVKLMAQVDPKDEIIFSPKGETKAVVQVFTDVDCGFCQKLHGEIEQINALGIEVRYLAYPRAGVNSVAAQKLATAWCSDDPKDTLTRMKRQEAIAIKTCSINPVADQYRLGQLVGVNGTPNMVTEDGYMIAGYLPADQLAIRLGITD